MPKAEEYIKGDHYLFKNKVLNSEEIAEGKFLLRFEKQFEVRAGHVVAISVSDAIEPRIYSICSGEDDSYMQVLYDLHPQGKLTPRLAKLRKGDFFYVSKPYGSFMPEMDGNMFWIATGTGLAPFYAMLRSGYLPVKFLHGARQADHFYFRRDFTEALKENYIRCNSGSDGQGDYFGRVSTYLGNMETHSSLNKYYLCGRALMVVEVRDLLIASGVPYENIMSEIFF